MVPRKETTLDNPATPNRDEMFVQGEGLGGVLRPTAHASRKPRKR